MIKEKTKHLIIKMNDIPEIKTTTSKYYEKKRKTEIKRRNS